MAGKKTDAKNWLVVWMDERSVRSIIPYETVGRARDEAWKLAESLDPKFNFVFVWDLHLNEFVMSPFKKRE
jgi:hypothetical protein